MRALFLSAIFLVITFQQIVAFSKYGRSCKDIGCLSSEVCVMAEDPCSYYSRDNCGSYPTCKPSGASAGPSCATFACPPTQICHLDNGTPKCVADKSSSSRVIPSENLNTGSSSTNTNSNPSYPAPNPSYPAQSPSYPAQNPSYPGYPGQTPGSSGYPGQTPGSSGYPSYPSQPSAPNYPGSNNPSYPGGLYPSLTTSRPAQGGSYPSHGGGYAGGVPGSGYPGGAPGSGYPGYPQQNNRGYPNQGYPSQGAYPGYPNQGYPQYPQGQYPSGYNNGGYQQPGYGNGNRYGGSPHPHSGSNPIVDKITDQLKTIGAGLLKNALGLNKQ